MILGVARVEDHQADEDDHVGEAVERRIKKAAETRHAPRKPCDLTVKHIEQVGNDQDDSGPEEITEAEEQTAADIDRNAYDREQIRIDSAIRQPAHHRTDNS